MATIHVNRGATTLGAFPEEQVREGIRSGRFLGTDLGWKEGMANWQPLSQFSEFAQDFPTAAAAAAAPPPQAPAAPATVAAGSTTAAAAPRSGLPWDQRHTIGFFNGFAQTVSMVLTRPTEAFTIMRTEGGLGDPLLFGVIGGSIGVIIWTLFSAALQSFGWAAALSQQNNSLNNMMGVSVGGAMLIFRLIMAPILIAIGLFVWTALVHVCLMMAGGANKTFEASFRALSFAYGATALLSVVPCCGPWIAFVWGLVADCIAIARTHETDTGRAVIAVLLPLIVCCGGVVVICLMLGVGIGALMQHNQ